MDGSESDQELTGNETDESEWASKVHEKQATGPGL
jgi:hypothetical protein